jgi:hypothetical protein
MPPFLHGSESHGFIPKIKSKSLNNLKGDIAHKNTDKTIYGLRFV